jgi:hypothetical protein
MSDTSSSPTSPSSPNPIRRLCSITATAMYVNTRYIDFFLRVSQKRSDCRKGNRFLSMPFACSQVTHGLARVFLKISFSQGRMQPGGFLKQGTTHHLAANAQSPMRYCIGENIKLQLWLSNKFDRIWSSCVLGANQNKKIASEFCFRQLVRIIKHD